MKGNKKLMARSLAGVMSASLVLSLCPVTALAAADTVYKDGTYTGTATVEPDEYLDFDAYGISMDVTVTEGKVSSVKVSDGCTIDRRNKPYVEDALNGYDNYKGVVEQIIANNGTDSIDTVSGATCTSKAIVTAVSDALQGAVNTEPEPAPPVTPEPEPTPTETPTPTPEKPDTSALEDAINEAKAKTQADYTEESWNTLEDALEKAESVLAEPESQEAVAEATDELKDAIEKLQPTDNGDDDNKEEIEYVLMNIPYADFYASEVKNSVPVDAVASATLNKTRSGSLVAGSYHTDPNGSNISGITFPVKVSDGVDLSAYTRVTDESSVSITVTNRGQTTTTSYNGKDALFENADYAYYVLSEAPVYYKELTAEGGKLTFGTAVGTSQALSGVTAELLTETSYGDYQLNLDGLGIDTSKVYAVVIGTAEGSSYGLRHLENVWRGNQLAWCSGFTSAVHNCPTSSAHYAAMMGQHINEVTYYTSDGIYKIPMDNIYVSVKFAGELSVADAQVSAGQTTVILPSGMPSDYDAEYSVDGLDVTVKDGVMTFPKDAVFGKYTLNVTDKSGKYADLNADFILITDKMPAAYNGNNETPALVKAEGAADEEFAAYIKAISSVSVNEKSYAASGRGATVIVNEDGTLKTDADPIKEKGTYNIVISSTGYQDLAFTYIVGESQTDDEIHTSELDAAVKAAKTLKESDYTEASWKAFAAALANAEKVLAAPHSQSEVDQAKTVLSDAVGALIKKTADNNNDQQDPEPAPITTPTVTPGDNSGASTATGTGSTGTVSKSSTAKTGDVTNIFGWISAAAAALGAGGVSLKMKGRKKR